MLDQYLIIHKSILPEYYEKVIETRRLLEDGKIRDVSQAVRQVGISRSTYYKYKDFILEPTEISGGRKAVLSMMLNHEQGVLSALLMRISEARANVLTITQSLPIRDKASVTISLDVSEVAGSMEDFVSGLCEVNSARANPEKIWVLMKAVFCRNTLCIARKSDKIRARIFQEAPKADCAVLP